jgi:UDP:flavonoid glycosyltransferase YjiC (YdhE family)
LTVAPSGLWLIYALGGGWGHLTRAVSLARVARARHRVRILTNSPYAPKVANALPKLEIVALDPSLTLAKAREQLIQHIQEASARCLIVDTFPRGLGGELANVIDSLAVTKVLVHRDLSPRYVSEAKLRAFVRSTYDLILIPGKGEGTAFADLPAAVVTEPWLIRNPPSEPCLDLQRRILVCAAGTTEEVAWYGALVALLRKLDSRLDIRCVAPTCPPGCPKESWIEHWPAVDLYPTTDVVIGGAGYNTIHECLAWQVPLIAHPWPRKYDRQWLRAQRAARRGSVTVVKKLNDAAEAVLRQLEQAPQRRIRTDIHNGVTDAITLIERVTTISKSN